SRRGRTRMTPGIKPLVAGNWKMNGRKASAAEFEAVLESFDVSLAALVDLLVCPPATLLDRFARMRLGHEVRVGGQDCHTAPEGAFTGDVSAEMLADIGASAVIVGHSERRAPALAG